MSPSPHCRAQSGKSVPVSGCRNDEYDTIAHPALGEVCMDGDSRETGQNEPRLGKGVLKIFVSSRSTDLTMIQLSAAVQVILSTPPVCVFHFDLNPQTVASHVARLLNDLSGVEDVLQKGLPRLSSYTHDQPKPCEGCLLRQTGLHTT